MEKGTQPCAVEVFQNRKLPSKGKLSAWLSANLHDAEAPHDLEIPSRAQNSKGVSTIDASKKRLKVRFSRPGKVHGHASVVSG